MSDEKHRRSTAPEIARQLHPDRRKNEAEYWAVRDQLLEQYRGQWIGFADGKVIASGSSPVAVFHAAEASGRHPFLICVGREEEPSRIRRATFCDGPRQAEWEFTLLLPHLVGSRDEIDWASLLPPKNVTRWLAVDHRGKRFEMEPAAAVPDPP